jgi:hypothetical protein
MAPTCGGDGAGVAAISALLWTFGITGVTPRQERREAADQKNR